MALLYPGYDDTHGALPAMEAHPGLRSTQSRLSLDHVLLMCLNFSLSLLQMVGTDIECPESL